MIGWRLACIIFLTSSVASSGALAQSNHHYVHKVQLKARAAYRCKSRHYVVDHGPAFRKQQDEVRRARELTRSVRQKDAFTRNQQNLMTQAQFAKQREQNFSMWQQEKERARQDALKKKQ